MASDVLSGEEVAVLALKVASPCRTHIGGPRGSTMGRSHDAHCFSRRTRTPAADGAAHKVQVGDRVRVNDKTPNDHEDRVGTITEIWASNGAIEASTSTTTRPWLSPLARPQRPT